MPFRDMNEVRAANKRIGHHYFDRETLRWWLSRIGDELYGGRYFVTSERDRLGHVWDGRRRYSVREALPDGSVDTVGEFGQYASRSGAHAAARRLAGQ
jgi:hypothetical protein